MKITTYYLNTVDSNKKTIQKVDHSNYYDGVYCKDKISFNGSIKEFTIKIDEVNNGYMNIGFAFEGLQKREDLRIQNKHG